MKKSDRITFLKAASKVERQKYYNSVAQLGCAACGKPYTPYGKNRTAVHHCIGSSFPAKRQHRPVIGLCSHDCHQYGKESVHGGRTAFTAKYGTQDELLLKVEEQL